MSSLSHGDRDGAGVTSQSRQCLGPTVTVRVGHRDAGAGRGGAAAAAAAGARVPGSGSCRTVGRRCRVRV
jgi:hypothetical protein